MAVRQLDVTEVPAGDVPVPGAGAGVHLRQGQGQLERGRFGQRVGGVRVQLVSWRHTMGVGRLLRMKQVYTKVTIGVR